MERGSSQSAGDSSGRPGTPQSFGLQRASLWAIWMIGGASAAASFIDLVSKPSSIITKPRAIWVSAFIVVAWILLEVWVRYRGSRWNVSGTPLVVRGIGSRYRFATLGILVLLWLPILIGRHPAAPSAPVEIGSAYHSDLPRLLVDRPSTTAIT